MYRLITCTWGWRFEACAAGWKPGRASQQSFDSTYLAPSQGSFDGTRNSSWQTPSHFPPHWWMHLVSKHSQSTVAKATSKFQSHKVPALAEVVHQHPCESTEQSQVLQTSQTQNLDNSSLMTLLVLCTVSMRFGIFCGPSLLWQGSISPAMPFLIVFSQVLSSLWCWTCEWGLKQKRNLGSANNI